MPRFPPSVSTTDCRRTSPVCSRLPPSVKIKRFRGLRSENRAPSPRIHCNNHNNNDRVPVCSIVRIRDTRYGTRCPSESPRPLSFLAFFRLFGFVSASYTCGPRVNTQYCLCDYFFLFFLYAFLHVYKTHAACSTDNGMIRTRIQYMHNTRIGYNLVYTNTRFKRRSATKPVNGQTPYFLGPSACANGKTVHKRSENSPDRRIYTPLSST